MNERSLFGDIEPSPATKQATRQRAKREAISRDIRAAAGGKAAVAGPRSPATSRPCPWCHHRHWWRSIYGPVICANCHPPAAPELVAEWIDPPDPQPAPKPDVTRPRPANRWPYVLSGGPAR